MAIETPFKIDKKEVISTSRYPLIAFVGPPGSGKSTVVDIFSKMTGAKVVIEPFAENPYLEYFYETGKGAYDCQATFLIDRFFEMQKIRTVIKDHLVSADSSLYGDIKMFETLFELGYATSNERKSYHESAEHINSLVVSPDVLFYRRCDPDEVDYRVRKRQRPMEMKMLKWNPNYFKDVARVFDRKVMDDKTRVKGLVTIDSIKFDALKQPEVVVRECCNWISYLTSLVSAGGLAGIGSDGTRLIIPELPKPPARDYSQKSWESARLDRT